MESYISRQEEEARKSILQLPQLKEEYYRHLLLELFDFHDIFYKEEHLVRIMTEFFYHSHHDVTELHKRVLSDFSNKAMNVSEKWLQMIRQLTSEQLHAGDFLQRVQRSAAYFEETMNTVYGNSLDLAAKIETNNKQAKTRFGEALADTRQAVLSRRYLLARILAERRRQRN